MPMKTKMSAAPLLAQKTIERLTPGITIKQEAKKASMIETEPHDGRQRTLRQLKNCWFVCENTLTDLRGGLEWSGTGAKAKGKGFKASFSLNLRSPISNELSTSRAFKGKVQSGLKKRWMKF